MARVIGVPTSVNTSTLGKKGGAGGVGSQVRVLGIKEAIAKLALVRNVVRLNLGQVMSGASLHMEALAKAYVSKASGNLESGIHRERVASYTWDVIASSQDGSNPQKNWYEYAPFVEFGYVHTGGRHIPGQFFMTRAYQETRPILNADLALMAKAIEAL